MNCRLCIYVGQYFVNWFNLLDHAINTILLGDANETVSARTSRARNAGRKWAVYACKVLTFLAKVLTFGRSSDDHCTYALDPKILPNSREIWNWSTGKLNPTPVTEIEDIEIGS